ncbi:MAG: hypothetical protein NVV59_12915 [Chitinophagaceae bacterium]|nr:hypothetical protein [Chitinophagaceae bacterium]
MKKTTLIAAAAFLLTTGAFAQTEPTPTPAPEQKPVQEEPQTEVPQTTTSDKYNNWTAETYKLQPMPEALTVEKIFPAIGKYEITAADGTTKTVTISLDETNKGLVWIEGLEAGTIKANLRKSPAVYKIPAQKLGEEKDAKSVAEGVMIYDREANVLNICLGCTYNAEDPAIAFVPAAEAEEAPVADAKTSKNKKAEAPKVAKVKPVHYTGTKLIETTAANVNVQ